MLPDILIKGIGSRTNPGRPSDEIEQDESGLEFEALLSREFVR